MDLEKNVCSLVLAQRLKTLGVNQNVGWDGAFYWVRYETSDGDEWRLHFRTRAAEDIYNEHRTGAREVVAALTCSELGEILPQKYTPKRYEIASASRFKWEFELPKGAWISRKTEADARAAVLAYLLENNLITL